MSRCRSLRSILGSFTLVAAITSSAVAWADDKDHWEKIVLQNKFYAEGAYHGDFNHDGKLDVVSGPFWYEGPDFKKVHEFYPAKPYDKNTYSENFFSFSGDVDKDGWDDIVVVGFPGKDSWWFRNPKGKDGNWDRFTFDTFVGNESPTYVDINADGVKDVVYINKKGQYGYGTPDPADPTKPWIFTQIGPIANLHHFTHGMGVGDVNKDGRLDLLEKDGWWEQPPAGEKGFWKQHKYKFANAGGAQMFAYDFDGDGDNDVLTSLAAHQYGLAWYEQVKNDKGEIDFKQHIILNEKPEPNKHGISFSQLHAVDLVDMDGDGILDIVTGKRHWAHNGHDPDERGPAVLYWFKTERGKDGVDFIPHLIDDDSGVGTQVDAVDLNGDGLIDIVVGNKLGAFINLQKKTTESARDVKVDEKKTPATAKQSADDRLSGTFPKNKEGKELNLGFESGNLDDWKTEGMAFVKQPVKGDTVSPRRPDMKSEHVGEYWIGTYEAAGDLPQGVLTSKPFVVSEPFASFLVAGGAEQKTRVELVDAATRKPFISVSGGYTENLRPVLIDLKDRQGQEIYLRVIDQSSGGWGHINFDDFRLHHIAPKLANEILPVKQNEFEYAGIPGAQAAKVMEFPSGFHADLIAEEPDVRQPIAMTIDERGRIWVAEAFEYPLRAPEGKGRDRILIFADADGDGRFETRKVFAEGLNLVSGIEVGFGGVFVGAAPYLLFIPDKNHDDKPDGKGEVLLDGWAYQDTHETLNSFVWGPDGWLYGCHGVFTHSNVGLPGASDKERQRINAGIWRYHPTKKQFEVFAHGTSNPWGVDFNDQGQSFLVCCVIPHLFHVIQGARYQRQAGLHFNPYTFADIQTIAKHRHWVGVQPHAGNNISNSAGGGHAHSGGMVYLGGSWPAKYRNQLFMNNIHGARINEDALAANGSGYVGDRAPDFCVTNDKASQLLYLRTGPDGQVYLIDWYDTNECHRVEREVHDQTNGRIFRFAYENYKPVKVDLSASTDDELITYQLDANDWYVRTARRLLQERAAEKKLSANAKDKLSKLAFDHADETRRLRGLWAIHTTTGLTDDDIKRALKDKGPYVRGFAIQLATEDRKPSESLLKEFARLAKEDTSPVVRLYLSSAADRLPLEQRWPIVESLVTHSEDQKDHNLPLMYWYVSEPLADVDTGRAYTLAQKSVHPQLLEFMTRRIAMTKGAEGLAVIIDGLHDASADQQKLIVQGLAKGLQGQRRADSPKNWPAISEKLLKSDDAALVALVRSLAVKFGDSSELALLRKTLNDPNGDFGKRKEALQTLIDVKDPELAPSLRSLLSDRQLRVPALRGLANYSDPATPDAVLAIYDDLSLDEKRDALVVLTSRAEYASKLLDAVGKKTIAAKDLNADLIRQLRSLKSEAIEKQVAEVWGIARDVSEDKAKLIEKYKEMILSRSDKRPDASLGRTVFVKTCATCHELFGTGSDVGPGLTGSNRRDLNYVLHNVIDPSSVMAKEYQPYTVVTTDGRVLTGLLKGSDDASYTFRTANETIVLPKNEVDEMALSPKSMMPEDQWQQLSEHEIRSLVAYLASAEQVPMRATAETASLIFNGKDLSNWHGEKKFWSVENGELIGKSPGLKHNTFLVSDLLVSDFRLRVKVKLTPNAGNSGIQFRSQELGDGEMKGYQADIGEGWWGKLYEENGRAILWDKSGESFVKKEEWNDYEIVAVGHRIRTYINGQLSVDMPDKPGATEGKLALQIHAGPAMEVRFKDFQLEINPAVESASTK